MTSTNYIILSLVTFENSTHLNVLMPITYWKHHSLKSKDVVIVSNTATAPRYINWETLTIMNSNLRWYSCKKLNLDIEWFWNISKEIALDRSAWSLAINVPEPWTYFFRVSSLAYPNLLGKKSYVVVVVVMILEYKVSIAFWIKHWWKVVCQLQKEMTTILVQKMCLGPTWCIQ